jgi:hypothetical protein
MSSVHFDLGLATPLAPSAGKNQRSLAHAFQSVLQGFSQRLSGDAPRHRSDVGSFENRPLRSGAPDLPAALLSTLDAAQNLSQGKTNLGSDTELDDEGMNLVQYLFARADEKSTDATEAWLLRNHAGYIVMQFAGYQPAGLSPKEIVDRYLEVMKGGNWPTG